MTWNELHQAIYQDPAGKGRTNYFNYEVIFDVDQVGVTQVHLPILSHHLDHETKQVILHG